VTKAVCDNELVDEPSGTHCRHWLYGELLSVVGVAQWLGRWSVAGGLSLIYAWSMVDVWPLCG